MYIYIHNIYIYHLSFIMYHISYIIYAYVVAMLIDIYKYVYVVMSWDVLSVRTLDVLKRSSQCTLKTIFQKYVLSDCPSIIFQKRFELIEHWTEPKDTGAAASIKKSQLPSSRPKVLDDFGIILGNFGINLGLDWFWTILVLPTVVNHTMLTLRSQSS